MLFFLAERGGTLRFRTDVTRADYVNVSFLAGPGGDADIPVHLSLRFRAGHAVTNCRRNGLWQAEESVVLPPGETVEISFARGGLLRRRPRVEIRIGGVPLCPPDATPLARFAGGHGITHLQIDGAVVPRSVTLSGAAIRDRPVRGGLALRPHQMLVDAWGVDAARLVQDLRICPEGSTQALRLVPCDRPEIAAREGAPTARIGGLSVLPGWLTEESGPEGVTLRLFAGPEDTGARLHLSRDEIRRRVELAAQAGPADVAARVLVAEHASPLWPVLSPSARSVARQAARTFGLPAPGPRPVSAPADAFPGDPLDGLCRAIGAALRDGVAPEAALAERPVADPALAVRLAVALTDPFCARDEFEALSAWAARQGVPPETVAADPEAWRSGAVLPWLEAAGRGAESAACLARLHLAPGGQVTTAALAHWLKAGLADPARREAAAGAWAALIARWAGHEGHRLGCRHMIGAGQQLAAALPHLSQGPRAAAETALITAHGLSAGFWAGPEAAIAQPGLATARGQFATLAAAVAGSGDPARAEAALSWFEASGCPGRASWRIALFGARGTAPRPEEPPAEAVARHPDPAGAALRHLAHPFGPDADPGLAALARQGILARYGASGLPQAPDGARQERATRAARAVLAGTGDLAAFLVDLAALSGPDHVHVGFGLGLSCLAGLSGAGREREAAWLCDALIDLKDRCGAPEAALCGMVPLRAARDTLSAAPGAAAARAMAAFLPEGEHAPVLPARPTGLAVPDPIFDTLVCLLSCRANLETRVPAIRAAWADRLADLGVPCLVVVGDGDDTLRDGVLALDAPDDYLGLPEKSLALARWVLERTPFAHLLKIDDDCVLDAEAFFHGLSWRKFDLHGRYLRRVTGQTDRLWHAQPGRRVDPDRSPEPAQYADGGSAYALSRRAMAELTRNAATPEGEALRLHSVMEDKLVGDLLARSGIGPVEEDHVCAIWRRPAAGCRPVPKWENGFYPSRAAPTRQLHLDRTEDLPRAAALRDTDSLWPKKVWPAHALRLRYNSDALELVSPPERLARAAAAPVALVAVMRNERPALETFLAHYRSRGVEGFLIADNLSDDGTLEWLAEEPDVAVFTVDTDYDAGRFGVTWQQTLATEFRTGRWTLFADADELLVCDTDGGLPALLREEAFATADAVRLLMLDLYPDRPLSEVALGADPFAEAGFCDWAPFLGDWPGEGPFGSGATWTSALRHRILPGSPGDTYLAQKFALLRPRPWMHWAEGLHHAGDLRLAPRDLLAGHFKYHGGFHAKARIEARRGRHWGGAREYRRYAALGPDPCLWDGTVSVPWREAPQVRQILEGGRLGGA